MNIQFNKLIIIILDINNYSFKSPEIKGSYTYSVSARWYDTGDIVYKFTINVE